MTAPELFDLNDDDGHATAVVGTVSTELEAEARTAEAGCPERAAIITAAGSDSS
ncbi:ferredoxin [Streptomyces sp. KL116D]|uniref:ferredoxin n=1 Tax=Streptomyces sp. KL116D TaxID=3045152 RepID=UPI003555F9E3